MNPEEIKELLSNHKKWLEGDSDGKRANLIGANLSDADLRGANLRGANLIGANLIGANLIGAKMSGAVFCKLDIAILSIVPECGEFTAFKKTREGVVELRIPAHAKRSNATGRKCRASEAVVVSLPDGCDVAHSLHDTSFVYKKGETVKPREPFCEDRWKECASGIHFYITRSEAESHVR